MTHQPMLRPMLPVWPGLGARGMRSLVAARSQSRPTGTLPPMKVCVSFCSDSQLLYVSWKISAYLSRAGANGCIQGAKQKI